MTVKLPAELKPENLTAIIDNRELLELELSPLRTVRGSLPTADYTLLGSESSVCIERKSLSDLVACCGRERPRFERGLKRMLSYEHRAVVVEATWADLERGEWKSKILPQAVVGSVLGWSIGAIPFIMAGSHANAGKYVARMLYIVARRRWREARSLVNATLEETRTA